MSTTLPFNNVLVLAHRIFKDEVAKSGGADYIIRYLKDRGVQIYSIEHPLVDPANKSRFLVDGKVVRQFHLPLKPPLGWILEIVSNLFLILRSRQRFDLVLAVDPLNFVSAYLLRLFGRGKLVWFHSIDYSEDRFGNVLLNKVYYHLYKFAVMQSDIATYVSLRMRDLITSFGKRVRGFCYHLSNSPEFDRIPRIDPERKDKYTLVYTKGSISRSEVLMLIRIIKSLRPTFPQIRLHLVGDVDSSSRDLISKSSVKDNFIIYGLVDYQTNLDILSRVWVGIAWYEGKRSFEKYADSLKIREYAAAGLVTVSNDGISTAYELKKENAGIMVRDEKGLREALIRVLSNEDSYRKMRNNALKWAQENDKRLIMRSLELRL